MKRRNFLTGAAIAGASTSLAAPSVAQSKIEMAIVATWPRDFPGLGLPAQRMAARIQELRNAFRDLRMRYENLRIFEITTYVYMYLSVLFSNIL